MKKRVTLLVVLCCALRSHAKSQAHAGAELDSHLRALLASIEPNQGPQTVHQDGNLALRSPDLAADDVRIRKQKSGCTLPEQVHLTYWSSTSVLVSWATCDAVVGAAAAAAAARNTEGVKSIVKYGTSSSQLYNTATSAPTSYVYDYQAEEMPSYASPLLHHVVLTDLVPGMTYYYRVLGTADSIQQPRSLGLHTGPVMSRLFNFTMPKASFPLRLGVIGDPGQTYNSSEVLSRVIRDQPDLLLLGGDFSYADDWTDVDERISWEVYGKYSYQPKWDTWGRLFEPLLSHVPFMHCDGNHEIEWLPNGEQQKAYNYRYPVPSKGATGAPTLSAVSESKPFQNLYYAVELPGVFKAIFLTSYSPGQTFSEDEEQYVWLQKELKETDRSRTPWLIVTSHAPWYNSYAGHYKEADCFRVAYEPLLLQHQVDVNIHWHLHSYERTKPVADFQVNECGPVHITIGDGGNIEGLYKEYIDELVPQPDFCVTPQASPVPAYQPQQCISLQDGRYCPDEQPEWSAYREPSFGHGMLELLNATHAVWTWNKNQWPSWKVADRVTIIRGRTTKCQPSVRAGIAALSLW